jgi:hypothetical protein
MDAAEDVRGDVQWMTYGQIADAFRIKKDSARRLAFRKGWRRQEGNDGMARVAVPADDLARAADIPTDDPQDAEGDGAHDGPYDAPAVSVQVAELREQLGRREGELAGVREALRLVEAAATEARERAAQATQQAQEAIARVAQMEERARTAERDLAGAQATLARLRGRGLLDRLFGRE